MSEKLTLDPTTGLPLLSETLKKILADSERSEAEPVPLRAINLVVVLSLMLWLVLVMVVLLLLRLLSC